MVPAPSNTPMPGKEGTQEGKARLYSVYLRPWVLDHSIATEEVPHLTNLNVLPSPPATGSINMRKRYRCKQPDRQPHISQPRSYAMAWRWYVRGNVVSRHAQKIIVQFMAASCGTSKRHADGEDNVEVESSPLTLPSNNLALERVHGILDRMSAAAIQKASTAAGKDKPEAEASEEDADAKALEQSGQINDAMQLTAKLWSRTQQSWPTGEIDTRISTLPDISSSAPPKKRKFQKTKDVRTHPRPSSRRLTLSGERLTSKTG